MIRQRTLNHFLGLGPEADAFLAAFRIPNILQNLLGEGALSASFIPVYSRLLAAGDLPAARRVAGAVAGLLGVIVGVAVLAGILSAPWLVALLAPGFDPPKRDLTVQLVRVLFPGAGCLVLGAWCLGVLNSHRRFFLSYAAPVVWNAAIIVTVVIAGPRSGASELAVVAAVGAVVGSLLQLGVQLPAALRAAGTVPLSLGRGDSHTGEVRRLFGPGLLNRGVAQVSAWVDTVIASLLPTGAVAGLLNAQLLYTLPVSLFGISVAAAELPAMASETARPVEAATALRNRLSEAMARIAFFVVPSAAAFLGLGHLIAGLVFQSGRFTAGDARFVWLILAGSSVGLLAATLARLFASAFYALGDATTPFRIAALRVTQAAALGYVLAVFGPGWFGLDSRVGAAGLTLSSGLAGWVEFSLLRRRLHARIGPFGMPAGRLLRLWSAALVGLGVGWGIALVTAGFPVTVRALLAILGFGGGYLSLTALLGVPQVRDVLRWVASRAAARR